MYHNFTKFLNKLKNNSNEFLLECIKDGFKACFEAHTGLYRTLDEFVNKLNLEAKNWPKYVKNELYRTVDWTMYSRYFEYFKSMQVKHQELLNKLHNFSGNKADREKLKAELKIVGEPIEKALNKSKEWFANEENFVKVMKKFNIRFKEDPEILTLSFEKDFLPDSYANLNAKIKNQSNPQFPRDEERHKSQKEIINDNNGINPEPVILTKSDGKYDVIEGNHRTVQSILYYRERGSDTFKLKAYVGEYIPDNNTKKFIRSLKRSWKKISRSLSELQKMF